MANGVCKAVSIKAMEALRLIRRFTCILECSMLEEQERHLSAARYTPNLIPDGIPVSLRGLNCIVRSSRNARRVHQELICDGPCADPPLLTIIFYVEDHRSQGKGVACLDQVARNQGTEALFAPWSLSAAAASFGWQRKEPYPDSLLSSPTGPYRVRDSVVLSECDAYKTPGHYLYITTPDLTESFSLLLVEGVSLCAILARP